MTTTVTHVKNPGGFDIYIGRRIARSGWPASIWQNPFKIGPNGTREEVIEKYRAYLLGATTCWPDCPS